MAELLRKIERENNNLSVECLKLASSIETVFAKDLVKKHLPSVEITSVYKVDNNYMMGMYLLKKEEYQNRYGSVTEELLFHATSEHCVDNIIKENLDWRRVSRNKYGRGVSFSDDADYANYHCNARNGNERAFLITKVLKKQLCGGNQNMTVPPVGYDTAIGNGGRVIVKFNDNEFLPLYVVYYESPDRTKSKHYRPKIHRFRRGLPWYF